MHNDLKSAAAAIGDQITQWRRRLHAHPELSGQERQTAAFVADELRKMGLAPRERVGGTHGLLARVGPSDGPAVALRADMDALPILEDTGLEFASRNAGVMHACGHDAHTAMLLGAARLLVERRASLRRAVTLIFQPAEEVYPGGAAPMIADGALDGVQRIFGLHISSQLPSGQLGTRCGAIMSGINQIDITIHGRGGHAAMPEQCIDPILAAAQAIVALQTVVSRSLAMTDSAVVSITQIEAGTADNIIPQSVRMRGTIRALDDAVGARVCQRVREVVAGVCAALGATASVELPAGYPVLRNDPAVVEEALRAAREVGFGDDALVTIPAQGGGEDFAYYCQKLPGAFAFLGAASPAGNCAYPHHHPRFNIDESVLPSGAALLASFALRAARGEAG